MAYRIFSMCSTYPPSKRPVCAFLSPKTEKVLEDMKRLKAEALLWSALGSGVAGLPLLRLEAEGERPWERGGWSDREFIQRCEKEGIKVFAVVWEAQGYNDILMGVRDGEICSWMSRRGPGKKVRWGLDAFYQDRLLGLGRWEDYFPGKFKEGEREIQSLVEACSCRSILGTKPWVLWILPHILGPFSCLTMCRNSPHWLSYLKRMVELQIDYGAHGIQVDESATPFESIWCGAGYCRHCSRAFLNYLLEKHGEEGLRKLGINPKKFSLRRFLLSRLVGPIRAHLLVKHFPFWREYRIAQIRSSERTFRELAQHAREYAARKGRKIEVTGNFAQLLPPYFPLMRHVDFICFELDFGLPPKRTHSPWYKLARAAGRGKEVTAVPSVLTSRKLRGKRANELLKFYAYEAFSCQANFMAPYSCYTMGKPYYPPLEPLAEANSFIARNRGAAEGTQLSDVCLVFSYRSHLEGYTFLSHPYMKHLTEIVSSLCRRHVLWEIEIFGDGEILPELPERRRGRFLVPSESLLTPAQHDFLERAEVYGEKDTIPSILSTDAPPEVFFSANRANDRIFLHMLNCNYDRKRDEMRPVSFGFSIRLERGVKSADFKGESGTSRLSLKDGTLTGEVRDLKHYGFVEIRVATGAGELQRRSMV